MIPYGRQDITNQDIAAVVDVLKSDWLTQGPAVPRFESEVAAYCGVGHAVAMSNATAALHVACAALGLGPGDSLWTSPNTFVASANCALYCGATVDFVDIDPLTYNMSVSALEEKLFRAEKSGKLPKIIVPVHFSGQSCDMAAIKKLAVQYGFAIIEDASHAIGGNYLGKKIGDGSFSDISVFSFHPVKIITTAEGGMATTNNPVLAEKMRQLRSHGITRDAEQMTADSEGDWYYQQIALGFNYRMTDMQAALGSSQLTRIDGYIKQRQEIALRYCTALAQASLRLPYQHSDAESAWHLFVIQVDGVLAGKRKEVFDGLRAAGILVNVHYIPVHLQPYYAQFGFAAGDFPEAEKYYARALSLPMYPTLDSNKQSYVIEQLLALTK